MGLADNETISATGRSTQNASEVLTDLSKEAERFCVDRGMAVEVVKKDVMVGRVGSDPGVRIGSGGFSSGFGGGEPRL